MFENIKNKLIVKKNENPKKSTETFVFALIVLIITAIAVNYILNGSSKNKTKDIGYVAVTNKNQAGEGTDEKLEQKLEKILYQTEGVGEVKVLITYSESSKLIPVYNEDEQQSVTEEEDSNGGKRKVTTNNNKKEVVNSNNSVVTKSVESPQIIGAVVVAKGANKEDIKTKIIKIVQAATRFIII